MYDYLSELDVHGQDALLQRWLREAVLTKVALSHQVIWPVSLPWGYLKIQEKLTQDFFLWPVFLSRIECARLSLTLWRPLGRYFSPRRLCNRRTGTQSGYGIQHRVS